MIVWITNSRVLCKYLNWKKIEKKVVEGERNGAKNTNCDKNAWLQLNEFYSFQGCIFTIATDWLIIAYNVHSAESAAITSHLNFKSEILIYSLFSWTLCTIIIIHSSPSSPDVAQSQLYFYYYFCFFCVRLWCRVDRLGDGGGWQRQKTLNTREDFNLLLRFIQRLVGRHRSILIMFLSVGWFDAIINFPNV